MYLFYCIGQSAIATTAVIAAISAVTAAITAVIAVVIAAITYCCYWCYFVLGNLLMINCYCNKSCKLDAVYFFHEARS